MIPAVLAAPAQAQRLEQFRKLSPANRLRLLEQVPKDGQQFLKVLRGAVTLTLVERGTLEATLVSTVSCRVKARDRDTVATIIKWVVDEGTTVKRGDLLLELDDAALQEQLAERKVHVEQAEAGRVLAAENLEYVKKDSKVDVRLAEIALRLVELEQKKPPADGVEKQLAVLKVEQANLRLERARAQARSRLTRAEADLRFKTAVLEKEKARQREIEEDIRACRVTAAKDGLVVYFVSVGFPASPLIAQGEPVREGQKLLQIYDLGRLLVNARIHEPLVSRVRKGQRAEVRVDAFPGLVSTAHVAQLAAVPLSQDLPRSDVKVYPLQLSLAEVPAGLKPGLSAEVRIRFEEKPDVLRVPVSAVVAIGQDRFCYVLTPNGLEERKVVPGLRGDQFVEIKEGLKEGETVLRDLHAQLPLLKLGAN
jgi:HlyD family secretion protein